MNGSKGFTLAESLVALILSSGIIIASLGCLRIIASDEFDYYFIEDFNAFYQMRLILALATDIEVWEDCIYYTYDDSQMTLKFQDNRIYITPGFNLLMYDVDSCYFDIDGYGIYMDYVRDEHERIVCIHK